MRFSPRGQRDAYDAEARNTRAMGIPPIWVIDPASKQTWRFRKNQLNLSSTFGEPGDPIHFNFANIEKLLD